MSDDATERPPTTISTGAWRSDRRASVSTCCGKVALNMTVCTSGCRLRTILVICGSKPMSNMRSASSSTRYVTRASDSSRPSRIASSSIMRPGVQTTTSEPRLSSAICSAMDEPP